MRRGLLRALHLVLMGALFLSFLQTSCVLAEEALDDEQSELSRMIQELTGFYYEDDAIQMTIQQRCDLADAAMEEPVVPSTKLKKYKYLYVGASRTNRIRKSVKDSKTYFEAAPGAGSRWFGMERDGKQACLLTIRSYLDARPDGNVIIELGNNDVCNMDVYMHVYKRLIEAVVRLRHEGRDLSLALVGEGTEEGQIRDLIRENGAEEYISVVNGKNNPYPYIKESDLLVCASYKEGYNLAVAEAMILGVPVLSTDCIGPRELLDGGKYGMLTENSDEGLYSGLKQLYDSPELLEEYRKKAVERRDFFDEDKIFAQIAEVLEG